MGKFNIICNNNPIFDIKNLSFTYAGQSSTAIEDISMQIWSGEFVLICGKSGCGKTTLVRLLKKELSPVGTVKGEILFKNAAIISDEQSASLLGFVMQNPESQIVTDKVWHEIAFGMENLGFDTATIRRRVAEVSSFFGIEEWFYKDTATLSGGQKQLVNLAAVMALQPEVLILDEPTSQLDPIAASEFISIIRKLNHDLGLTIILIEHRLEEVFDMATHVCFLENGKMTSYQPPAQAAIRYKGSLMVPAAARIFDMCNATTEKIPLNVREGRTFVHTVFENNAILLQQQVFEKTEVALSVHNVSFRYKKNLPDIIKDLTFTVHKSEIYFILGGNGVGKSTTLSVISGINKPYTGNVVVLGKKLKDYKTDERYNGLIAYLPQNPIFVFSKDTVLEELEEMSSDIEAINKLISELNISDILCKNPLDLSGGECQKAALAKILLQKPQLLLLDEPCKGLDPYAKEELSHMLKLLAKTGITIIAVSHDLEFAAITATKCALFFDGNIISEDEPHTFFSKNSFYTTPVNKIFRDICTNAITYADVKTICEGVCET